MSVGMDLAGTLMNTLTPEGVLTLQQAFQRQQEQALAQRTQQATNEAQQATQAYQQAAGAPPPALSPADIAVPTLFGGIAAVLQGRPEARQRAEDAIKAQRAALLQARAQNLQALRDAYEQKATAAQRAGDLETELTARTKMETLSKQFELVNANANRATTISENVLQRRQTERNALIAQGINPDTAPNYRLLPYVAKTSTALGFGGQAPEDVILPRVVTLDGPHGEPAQVLDIDTFKGTEANNAALKVAADNGIHVLRHDEFKVATDIQGARDNIRDILDQLAASPNQPQTAGERFVKFIGLRGGALAQLPGFETESAFNSWRTAAIRNLRATAGSGGLRINQREIELAVANDLPKYTDTAPVAKQKMANVLQMLNNALAPLTTTDWRQATREAQAKQTGKLPPSQAMMDPQGNVHLKISRSQVRANINKGWARITTETPVPPDAAPQVNGTVQTSQGTVAPPQGTNTDPLGIE